MKTQRDLTLKTRTVEHGRQKDTETKLDKQERETQGKGPIGKGMQRLEERKEDRRMNETE